MKTSQVNTLLIEDNLDDAHYLMELLSENPEEGFSMDHVETVEDALVLMARKFPNVILLDLSLPDSTGEETYRQIQKAAPLTPIVIITGLKDRELANQLLQKGAQDYLDKGSLNTQLLLRSIQYAIEREKLIRELKTAKQHISDLAKLIPICASCHQIRDDKGSWERLEKYFEERGMAEFTHSICPDCMHKLYPELYGDKPKPSNT